MTATNYKRTYSEIKYSLFVRKSSGNFFVYLTNKLCVLGCIAIAHDVRAERGWWHGQLVRQLVHLALWKNYLLAACFLLPDSEPLLSFSSRHHLPLPSPSCPRCLRRSRLPASIRLSRGRVDRTTRMMRKATTTTRTMRMRTISFYLLFILKNQKA